jgi:hypothetical protein
MYKDQEEIVGFTGNDNIGNIKTSLSSMLGISRSSQILMCNREVLDDSKLPSHHGVVTWLTAALQARSRIGMLRKS